MSPADPPSSPSPRPSALRAALRMAWPGHWLALFSGAKDFSGNPVIGSARLNAWGLHVARKRLAHAVCEARRHLWLKRPLPAEQVAAFRRDGFVALTDFLPDTEWQAVRAELCAAALPMIDMVQGHALTRRANLDAEGCEGRYPSLARLLRHPQLMGWLRYAAGCPGQPLIALQCIHAHPDGSGATHDPQTDWHSDTFQSAGKAWLFLHDVRADEGPFGYWPGSHHPSAQRLAWEQRQSVDAAHHPNRMHARGSLRASEAELRGMGRATPYVGAVAGNTLVVADTGGFHRRTPSTQATVRLEIYLSLRRNPFFAGLYPSVLGLPGVRRHWAGWLQDFYRWQQARRRASWRPVPEPGLLPEERERLQR